MDDHEMKRRILDYMRAHQGKDNAITIDNIAGAIGNHEDAHQTRSNTRRLMRELTEDGNPIASGKNGFYIIKTKGELQEFLINLGSRIRGIRKRMKNVTTAFNERRDPGPPKERDLFPGFLGRP